jgi:hypothetical protein
LRFNVPHSFKYPLHGRIEESVEEELALFCVPTMSIHAMDKNGICESKIENERERERERQRESENKKEKEISLTCKGFGWTQRAWKLFHWSFSDLLTATRKLNREFYHH